MWSQRVQQLSEKMNISNNLLADLRSIKESYRQIPWYDVASRFDLFQNIVSNQDFSCLYKQPQKRSKRYTVVFTVAFMRDMV